MCGKLWDGPWVGIGGCVSIRNGMLEFNKVAAVAIVVVVIVVDLNQNEK